MAENRRLSEWQAVIYETNLPLTLNHVRGSIVVSISACHAEDPGLIPGRGVVALQKVDLAPEHPLIADRLPGRLVFGVHFITAPKHEGSCVHDLSWSSPLADRPLLCLVPETYCIFSSPASAVV